MTDPQPHEQDEEPIVAKLVDADPANDPLAETTSLSGESGTADGKVVSGVVSSGDEVRVGSPFANDDENWPAATLSVTPSMKEVVYDVGPLRYTAIGAVAAAIMVLFFAAAGAWYFPGGGALVAALGCALSIFGLYSPHRYYAAGCLTLHMLLFMASYARVIT